MHSTTFLQDLAVVMIVAGLVTVLFHRFKQPVVLGYIIAGAIIGPHTPPFPLIQDEETIKSLSELGVIFLMFSLGLEFSLRKLKQVGSTAFIAATLEIVLMAWAGYEIGRLFGWKVMDSLFLGAMLSISSTTIIIKALGELGKGKEKFSELIFGILIVEDILAIVMIALLSGIALSGSLQTGEVFTTVGRLGIFLVVVLVLGLLAVPRLLSYIARARSNEMLLVAILGLCFGVCLLAVKLGYSVALGAFVIGAVIAEAKEIHQVERLMEPLRDMFSAVFFVSIGLLIEPRMLIEYSLPIAVITLVVVVGKVLTCSFGTFIAGHDTRTSLRVGMGLAQIGEFSFIIASLGLTLGVTSNFLYPIAVTVSAITTLLTPYLIKSSDGLVARFDRSAPKSLVRSLAVYTNWVGHVGAGRRNSLAGKLVRKWIWQMVLNLMLVAGIFIGAAFIARNRPVWVPQLPGGDVGLNSILWLGSVLLSLPLLLATFRKLQALGLLIADISVSRKAAGERAESARAVVSHLIPLAGLIALGLFILVLSSTILPPTRVLLVLISIVALVGLLLRRTFVKLYSRAQISLQETFATPPTPLPVETPPVLASVLREAQIESLAIGESAPAAHRRIAETALRTQTGASIVAIGRGAANLVNPGADEELKPNDQVVVLGTRAQLEAARKHLLGES